MPKKPADPLQEHLAPHAAVKERLKDLSAEEAGALFFHMLNTPEYVSQIAQIMASTGYAQRNMPFAGAKGTLGDEVILSRWRKAASGSIIIATRYNAGGELEILFGKKQVADFEHPFWALPGGHYELDHHQNLEHTLVAELIEETGIIPLTDEFLDYIKATIEEEKDILPYNSVEEAGEEFISRDLAWELITVISGPKANWAKRSINVAYRVHFNDGDRLRPTGSDDIGELTWFPLSKIEIGDPDTHPKGAPLEEDRVYLSTLHYGNDEAVEMTLRKIRALQLATKLAKDTSAEDLCFFFHYIRHLKSYSYTLEDVYGLKHGTILRNHIVGPKHNEYVERAFAMHNLLPHLEKDIHRLLHHKENTSLHLDIQKHLITPFITEEDYR